MSTAVREAEHLLRKRISELDEERSHLERAVSALRATNAKPQERPKRSARSRSKPKGSGRRTAARSERKAQLLELAQQSPAASNADLARTMNVSPAYVSQLLKEMRSAGTLSREEGLLTAG